MRPILALLSSLALAGTAAAQTGPLITERPGFSTSPQALAPGTAQIEAGIGYNILSDRGDLPQFLGRYGIGEDTEIQFGWNGVTFGEGDSDVGGVSFSVKHAITGGSGLSPALGIIGTLSVPSDDEVADKVDGTAGLLWSNSLGGGFGLFGTVTIGSTSFGDERFFEATNAVGLSYSPGGPNGFFVEHYIVTVEDTSADIQYIDAGWTHLVSNDVQLDVTGGVSVGDTDAGSFLGAGLAVRF